MAYDEDGTEIEFTSGEDDDAELVNEILREERVSFPSGKSHPASSHVEAKVAGVMRDQELTVTVLVINNEVGVCAGIYGCRGVLTKILPPGAKLIVWSPPTIEAGEPDRFIGG